MRTIGVVTVARSDYGIYLPILRRIKKESGLRLKLIVGGMHLSPEFGHTAKLIEEDGFNIDERVEMLLSSDSSEGIAASMGLGIMGFAKIFSRERPDILLVLGDRFEMYSAVVAALPFKIPVAHIHGGELTEGAIDDAIRHSITKLSHLHFTSNEIFKKRIIQMGEEPWRVTVCGAPALDNLSQIRFLSREEIEDRFNLDLGHPFLLVTYHPVTLEFEQTEIQVREFLAALKKSDMPIIFTLPNSDTSNHVVTRMIREFVMSHPRAWLVNNFGTQAYFSILSYAAAMVGNSSSGIIEAASFKLPVVNVGSRQRGRLRGKNVIDADCHLDDIFNAILKAVSPKFRNSLSDLKNPYGQGNASEMIVEKLKNAYLDDKLIVKKFHEEAKT